MPLSQSPNPCTYFLLVHDWIVSSHYYYPAISKPCKSCQDCKSDVYHSWKNVAITLLESGVHFPLTGKVKKKKKKSGFKAVVYKTNSWTMIFWFNFIQTDYRLVFNWQSIWAFKDFYLITICTLKVGFLLTSL